MAQPGFVKCEHMIRWLSEWQTVAMHLIPADRAHRRMIDGERVCQAIEALSDGQAIQARARQFSLLGDPTRLRVLVCIAAAEPISVSDLAVATGLADDHVSQTLRFLRASHTVSAERDGRVIRYELTDGRLSSRPWLNHTCRYRASMVGSRWAERRPSSAVSRWVGRWMRTPIHSWPDTSLPSYWG